MRGVPPPGAVLRAFGVTEARPLAGGQGDSWHAGDLVLKPHRSRGELEWLESLPATTSVRTARPIRAADGRILVDGWSAMPFLAGTHPHERWGDIAAAGRSLSREFDRVTEPEWVQARIDPWAAADRIAWEEDRLPAETPRWMQALAGRRARLDGTRTLIHGDLTGNVLLEPGQPSAIIDLSPYFRPVEYATAILVVDAVCFERASPQTFTLVADEDAHQLLLRAIIFRAATDLLRDHDVTQALYGPAIALLHEGI